MVQVTRVLVCDDVEDMRALFGAIVDTSEGLELVGTAENGLQAIDLAAALQPDVILLDIAMPAMDGLTALPEILRVASKAKVIIVSAYPNLYYGAQAIELGASRFIEKGSLPKHLVAVIREVSCV